MVENKPDMYNKLKYIFNVYCVLWDDLCFIYAIEYCNNCFMNYMFADWISNKQQQKLCNTSASKIIHL